MRKKVFSVFLILAFLMVDCGNAAAASAIENFTDLDENHWAYHYIADMVAQGLFTGVSKDTFSPDAPMTRAMFVTVLAKLNDGGHNGGEIPFTDVPEDAWYLNGVAWAYQSGIVSGVTAADFDPEGYITREQMAVMLYRYLGYVDFDFELSQKQITAFSDTDSISGMQKKLWRRAGHWGLFQARRMILSRHERL